MHSMASASVASFFFLEQGLFSLHHCLRLLEPSPDPNGKVDDRLILVFAAPPSSFFVKSSSRCPLFLLTESSPSSAVGCLWTTALVCDEVHLMGLPSSNLDVSSDVVGFFTH